MTDEPSGAASRWSRTPIASADPTAARRTVADREPAEAAKAGAPAERGAGSGRSKRSSRSAVRVPPNRSTFLRGAILAAVTAACVVIPVSGVFDPGPGPAVDPADDQSSHVSVGSAGVSCAAASKVWNQANRAQVDLTLEHPRRLIQGFGAARDALASVEPPSEIAEDWRAYAADVATIAAAVEAAGPDDVDDLRDALERAVRSVNANSMAATSVRVTKYFQAGCET